MRVGTSALLAVCIVGCATRDSQTSRSSAALAATGSLYLPRALFAWTTYTIDRPLLSGGFDATAAVSSNEVFDPATGKWSRVKDSANPHANHTLTYLPSLNRVLFAGRANELWNPVMDTFTPDPSSIDRDWHTATTLASGKVLLAGGQNPAGTAVASQLYDPMASAGSRYTATGAMVKPRVQHSAVLLGSGKVLIAGGRDPSVDLLSHCELYDPSANAFTATGAMSMIRLDVGAVRLADGKVLAAGGFNGLPMSLAETYDPTSGSWTKISDLGAARAGATATILSTGRVLLAGGDGPMPSSTEVYDPKTGTWSKGPALSGPRWDHAAIPISGGRILIVGGYNTSSTPISTSEIFGGLGKGAACVIDEECTSSKCIAGACDGGEAGVDATVETSAETSTDSATDVAIDTRPPDASTKPVVGSFVGCSVTQPCASGVCVAGVCCDRDCSEPCHSCALPWAPGICTLEPYGTDRKNTCGASGSCVSTCDGKGGCVPAGTGTQCSIAKCTGPSTGVGPALCGASTCDESARLTFECAPFACEPVFAACRDSCTESSQCAPGYLCDAPSRTCIPAPAAEDDGGCAMGRSSEGGTFAIIVMALLAIRRR